ncbi:MAG: hypothetical protein QOG73_1085 [Acetobacteraceae bacterium]|jgi:hypothetical protein|nr:hypothetical protein [Acetobacteraceae bacterium]
MPGLDPRIPSGSGGCGGARITSGHDEDEKFGDITATALPAQFPRHLIDPVHRQREHPAFHQVVHHPD